MSVGLVCSSFGLGGDDKICTNSYVLVVKYLAGRCDVGGWEMGD